MKNKRGLAIVGLVAILFVGIALIIYLAIIPPIRTNQFYDVAEPTVEKLETEFESFKKDNFMAGKNITTSLEEAKRLLEDHIGDLNSTKKNVSVLKEEYEKLKPPNKLKSLDEKIDQAFELSNAILEKYDRSLVTRKAINNAYGDSLIRALKSYDSIYYKGGDRGNFILQTDNITQLANTAIVKMNNIDVADDEREYFELKLKYLKDAKSSFEKLNSYYRNNQFESVTGEILNLNNKNKVTNQKIVNSVNDYVEKSTIAEDLRKLQELINEIQVDFP